MHMLHAVHASFPGQLNEVLILIAKLFRLFTAFNFEILEKTFSVD